MQPVQAAGEQDRRQQGRRNGKDQCTVAPSFQTPAKKAGQPHDQRNFEYPEGLAVELRISIADRTAENPVRDRPELAAGIIVMCQKVRKGMQKTGAREGAQDQTSAPECQPEQTSPDEKAVVHGEDSLPALRKEQCAEDLMFRNA